jgi:hypothetical protein
VQLRRYIVALTVGRVQRGAPADAGATQEGGQDGQTQKCGAGLLAPHSASRLVVPYAAALAFSLVANSCLIWAEIAATSTL